MNKPKLKTIVGDIDVEHLLYHTMEAEVIRSLLSGNDTQCFTTSQYEEARDAWIAKVAGATRQGLGLDKPPSEFARKQLLASSLVREVSLDVWTFNQ